MLRRQLSPASPWRRHTVCLLCTARSPLQSPQSRSLAATSARLQRPPRTPGQRNAKTTATPPDSDLGGDGERAAANAGKRPRRLRKSVSDSPANSPGSVIRRVASEPAAPPEEPPPEAFKSLKTALLGTPRPTKNRKSREPREPLEISVMFADDLEFKPVDVEIPPVPMLSYGLDRVLFNPGVYLLQDPRSHIYNFDPYLEKIMPVSEFDFDALSEYKTSSKDEELLAITQQSGAKFTGSTSSMSGVLQHFHYVLSGFRGLNHEMLSREFPEPSKKFSKITLGPSAVFLRYKNGVYAIDADKSYDSPNIMSWLGHSLEKLLTTERDEFERYRKSSPDKAPADDNSSRCYHYSKQGNLLMRSQLDAYDPRLPGTGVFDLKTRAVVSIRMNHTQYEEGVGYQLRQARGEWESYEREFYDMTRATLLKYSLQVRMGRMDGIFLAYHNIERIFGFQYLSLSEMDAVLHGQRDTTLGDQEFKLSISLLDELLTQATAKFPNTSLRIHVEARDTKQAFMYIFVEPVTEEQADEIQSMGDAAQKEFARSVVGVGKDNPEVQADWQDLQDEVNQQIDEDRGTSTVETQREDSQKLQEDVNEGLEGESNEQLQEEGDELVHEESNEQLQEESNEQLQEKSNEKLQEESNEKLQEEEADKPHKEATERIWDKLAEDSTEDTGSSATEPAASSEAPKGPLLAWTLTVRSQVNDGYVERPVQLGKTDNWKIEYNLQEMPEGSRWSLYKALKERRRKLVGNRDEEADKGLKTYRDLIQRYSNRGREWRNKQDQVIEEKGVHIYRPLGPGSPVVKPLADDNTKEDKAGLLPVSS